MRTSVLLCLFTSITVVQGWSQEFQKQSPLKLTIDQVMSAEEFRASGINTLTPTQRAVLNEWLQRYTLKVLELAAKSSSLTEYEDIGGRHWIKEKIDGGSVLILDDGSRWEIQSLDRINTRIWLKLTNIIVLEASIPIGEYKYQLFNTDDDEKVLCKYLGKK